MKYLNYILLIASAALAFACAKPDEDYKHTGHEISEIYCYRVNNSSLSIKGIPQGPCADDPDRELILCLCWSS